MKAILSSDWGLQPDPMKLDSLVIAHQPWRGEYVPGPCTHRPSSHESRGRLKSVTARIGLGRNWWLGLSRNKVAVPEGAAGTPPFWRGRSEENRWRREGNGSVFPFASLLLLPVYLEIREGMLGDCAVSRPRALNEVL
jgi:hypothetical protein